MFRKKIEIIIILILSVIFILNLKSYANTEEDITSNFKDENLKNAILELAKQATQDENKTQIYKSDIDKIVQKPGGTSLKLASKGIKDLSGLEEFYGKDITWIFLDWNELTDLSVIAGFSELTKISFSGNSISDLSVLSNLQNLKNITGINNQIENIETLSSLKSLEYVCLDGNKIKDISYVKTWTNLKELSLQNNNIENIPNLEKLANLEKLNLSNNNIKNLSEIGKIQNLKELYIDNNQLENLEEITSQNSLQVLSCSNNYIANLDNISKLEKLENLNINKNQIKDIEPIVDNKNIKYLYIDNNYILNFESLKDLPNLEKYSIYNQVYSVEIKEKLEKETVSLNLPNLYKELYDINSFIHKDNLKTEVVGSSEYTIDESNENILLKSKDLEAGNVTLKVSDSTNTLLIYSIMLDKTPPQIIDIENEKIYETSVTPQCKDTDIASVELLKDNQIVQYELGKEIKESGKYILTVTDKAGNVTTIKFEIQGTLISSDDGYKLDGDYILGVNENTQYNNFKTLLNGNVDYKVYRGEELLQDNQIVATGDRLVTIYNKTFYIVVNGDISKDGQVTIKDFMMLRKQLLNLQKLDTLQEKAADVSSDNQITIKDLMKIQKVILKID